MLDIGLLGEVIEEQAKGFASKESGLIRTIDMSRIQNSAQVVVISGVRRSGKSTLLRQIAAKLDDYHYVNFDDERLIDFEVSDFNRLLLAWKKRGPSKNVLIDEIQNITAWERFIRRIHDEGYKIYLTGSNAKLLSSELSTHLTGRYLKVELYPFSFKEFLDYKNAPREKVLTTSQKAEVLNYFDAYLKNGGFPEYVVRGDQEILKQAYDDIVYKDIIARFGVREIKPFRELAAYLFSNLAKESNYNALAKMLGMKSVMTVRKFVGFLQESYLVFELFKYDHSLKKQFVSAKKIYVIDNGMRGSVAFSATDDRGRLLENMIFLELKRRGSDIYFYKNAHECDFIVKEKNKITQAIQITVRLTPENREREMAGVCSALDAFALAEGVLITEDQEETLRRGNFVIHVVPAWKGLLEK